MSKIKLGENPTYTQREYQEAVQELSEQAELVESPADMAAFAKSTASLAASKIVADAKPKTDKTVDGDDDKEEEEDGDPYADGSQDADETDANDPNGPVPAAPVGRQMRKSLSESMEEAGVPVSAIESGEILEAVSEALLENNRIGLESQRLMRKSVAIIERLDNELTVVKSELANERAFNKSVRGFIEGIQTSPVGTPRGSVPFNPSTSFAKGASTSGGGDAFGASVAQTLRGLTEGQLIKGLAMHLDATDGKESNLSISDLSKIGTVPISDLNPKIAEVAAKELGLELTGA